jgi:predicted nuclease with TOPRIM domain
MTAQLPNTEDHSRTIGPDVSVETIFEGDLVERPTQPHLPQGGRSTIQPESGESDPLALRARIQELEARLGERVEENRVLHDEVRCLLAERRVRDEYISYIEPSLKRLPEAERQLLDTDNAYKQLQSSFESYRVDAERRVMESDTAINAFRARRVVRVTDRLASIIRRHPAALTLVRTLKRSVRP